MREPSTTLGRTAGRRCGEPGTAAAGGSALSGLRLCRTKRLTDGTAEPQAGLEAEPALAPGKIPAQGLRVLAGQLGERPGPALGAAGLRALVEPPHGCRSPSELATPGSAALPRQPQPWCQAGPGDPDTTARAGWHRAGSSSSHGLEEETPPWSHSPRWCRRPGTSALSLERPAQRGPCTKRKCGRSGGWGCLSFPRACCSCWSCREQGQARDLHTFLLGLTCLLGEPGVAMLAHPRPARCPGNPGRAGLAPVAFTAGMFHSSGLWKPPSCFQLGSTSHLQLPFKNNF